MSYIRIWYFERETRDLVRIRQCEMIESFLDAFRDYGSGVALSILCEVTEAVLPDHEPCDANFRLLLMTAQTIKRTVNPELPLAYFSMWTVRLGGWLPPLDQCGACGTRFSNRDTGYISGSGSALVCAKCRRSGMRAVSPGALGLARRMLTERLDRIVELPGGASAREMRELSGIMLDAIERQIDRRLMSRELLEPIA